MKHFVGLDVSVKETSICVVDGDGDVVLQTSVRANHGLLSMFLRFRPLP